MSSLFGGLFGGSKPAQQDKQDSASADIFSQTQFRSTVQPSQQPPASAEGTMKDIALDASAGPSQPPATPAPAPEAPSSLGMLQSSFDASKLHPMANLGDNLDFLNLDEDKLTDMEGAESVLPSRGWTDDLCVGTGTTYLTGLLTGGAWGMKEGLSRPLGPNPSMRLRLNSVLNSCTRRGSFTGNSLGVLDSLRGHHDALNSIGAGALSGGLFKCTSGVRPAAVGATMGAGAMAAW
ncbi:import inner membrane translocase subunit [Trichosporon asahii var. asahii CBS 2479]|uniref:Import inner membrane translocase subunit n=1 Tax=Trichosporon asahii var. asahii (strain ATCC 90039 / CBS 2479 / JCM 2466 / KCTC 7840 / NBRC 103889/ NCYC 2677 / UAMH 7654) TaxID=1186058 RepID=J4UHP8_TRIAS|nr:import inner membrane translocase subunit [Trichosporon asahii var. asahii CBS 2479]EJT51130.1 import inner membrane translocase subunit [Trichosporon asahii var. asahii CBS 2479]